MNAAALFVAASAAIAFLMGTGHLWITFFADSFDTRDPETARRMREDSPRLTRRTTVWDAWIGFNGSHSFGPMFFGAVYGYLAMVRPDVLFGSTFLQAVGGVLMAGYLWLGWRYWFRTPLAGLVLASTCYAAGIVLAVTL